MLKPKKHAALSQGQADQRPASQALALWTADAVAAILFAAALAASASAIGSGARRQVAFGATALVAAAVLRAVIQYQATGAGQRAAQAAKRAYRARIYLPLLQAAPGSRVMVGEQIADAVDRIEDIDGYHARFLPLRRAAVISPLLIAAAAAFGSPVAAGIMLATLLPFALGMALAGSASATAATRQFESLARLSGLFIDRVRALPVIIGFGAEERITRQLGGATQDVANRTLAVLQVAFVSSAVIEFFAALSVALVAVYCGFHLLGLLPFPAPEKLDLAEALFALALAPEFYFPMRRLAAAYHDKQTGTAAMERLDALAAPARPPPAPAPRFDAPPRLRFESLVVDYGEHRIGPISLDVPAAAMTAISGPTGSGKSSLLAALLGLVPIGSGMIRVNESTDALAALDGQIGWAGQVTALLPGTIAENIAVARVDAGAAEIAAAAQKAGLGALIASRPLGIDTPLDHRGSGLSGGERRRIGIARVLLKDAPLWLLDEPTADLDAAAAADIEAILREAGRGRTVIITTHSVGLAATADVQLVLP
jgi:ATP-binding cassette subfamily C protein CydD